MNYHEVWIRFVAASLLFSTILSLRLHAQQQPVPTSVGLPKPAMAPTAGTWKYKETNAEPKFTRRRKPHPTYSYHIETYSVTIKDDGDVWTVTAAWKSRPATNVSTLEKGTLILRKETYKQFRPWEPLTQTLDFTGNEVIFTMTYVGGQHKPVEVAWWPVFGGGFGSYVTIGCLPLAEGYSTNFRYLDLMEVQMDPEAPVQGGLRQVKVVGMERVTVPAGTFDSYKVELTSPDTSFKRIVWIAKDSRMPVKTYEDLVLKTGTLFTTTELVP